MDRHDCKPLCVKPYLQRRGSRSNYGKMRAFIRRCIPAAQRAAGKGTIMEFGLSEHHRAIISGIFSKYPQVKRVFVYGSRAKGNCRPGSDIDMAIMEEKDIPADVLLKLTNDFDDSLLPFSADLCIFSELTNPDLAAHIRRAGKPLYTRSAEQ